jgi:hypothetical protein
MKPGLYSSADETRGSGQPVNHAVHAGGCRRHHRLGHRMRTHRSPAAGASASHHRNDERLSSSCGSRRSSLAARLGIETMYSAWPFICRPLPSAGGAATRAGARVRSEVRFRGKSENICSLRDLPVLTDTIEKGILRGPLSNIDSRRASNEQDRSKNSFARIPTLAVQKLQRSRHT